MNISRSPLPPLRPNRLSPTPARFLQGHPPNLSRGVTGTASHHAGSILEAVRSVPINAGPAPEQQPNRQQAARPLTPGFKPAHSDAPPMKVTEMPVERQQADPWAMRAELKPR